MKKIFALALATVTACTAPATAQDSDPLETCIMISELAGTIMSARQAGAPIRKMIEIAKNDNGSGTAQIVVALVDDAYAQQQWHGDDLREYAVTSFADAAYSACRGNL